MGFWPVWDDSMALLPEGFMFFVFLTWDIMLCFWKKSISGFCMGPDFFRKNDYDNIFWREKKYLWWELSCFFERVGGWWSHGSQPFFRENGWLRDHVRVFCEVFRFFCHAKRLPWAFFWIFCVFYMGFTMFATFRRFWGSWWIWCDEKSLFSDGKFGKKCVVGFFRKKSMYAFLWKLTVS